MGRLLPPPSIRSAHRSQVEERIGAWACWETHPMEMVAPICSWLAGWAAERLDGFQRRGLACGGGVRRALPQDAAQELGVV
jgi:hypothetical protein